MTVVLSNFSTIFASDEQLSHTKAAMKIFRNIFEKKILPKVRKMVVAPDYQKCNTNRTKILYEKTKVVNLRFFEKISKIKKKMEKNYEKKS